MSRRMRDSRHGAKLTWWRHDVVRWHVTAASPGSLTSYKLPTPFLLKISQLPGIQVVITPHNLSQLISFLSITLNTFTVWAANQWGPFLVLYETCHVTPQILMYGNYIHNYYISCTGPPMILSYFSYWIWSSCTFQYVLVERVLGWSLKAAIVKWSHPVRALIWPPSSILLSFLRQLRSGIC